MISNEVCRECVHFSPNLGKFKKYKHFKVLTGNCGPRKGLRLENDRACYEFKAVEK